MTDDVFVRLTKMPSSKLHEFVTPCAEGYCIYINEALDRPHMLQAYNHAMEHIINDDWNKDGVQEIEIIRHERE